MARSQTAVELNNFVAGLITEASPLTFPANASLDEENFVLNLDGSRSRRAGLDLEEGYVPLSTGVPFGAAIAITSQRWRNAGGISEKTIEVVQIGNELRFFDVDIQPLSAGLIHAEVYNPSLAEMEFSYTVVDGMLVVATGSKEIDIYTYNSGVISRQQQVLYIRDLFGVDDIVSGVDITAGNNITVRPATSTNNHIYNLRNQSWATPKVAMYDTSDTRIDPIKMFRDEADNGPKLYPANADSTASALYANTSISTGSRVLRRLNTFDILSNPSGTYPAAKGYFIIDAMSRGTSRLSAVLKLQADNPQLTELVNALPTDVTPGGPTVVAEYSGRVFYGGFSGQVVDGDGKSPRLSSYVMFSQLVEDITDINKCYQNADPTSPDDSDLVDTDGGFIRIEGAYGIMGFVNVGSGIAVLARNGVWLIQGGSDYGFSAKNYKVTQLTPKGCIGAGSIVSVDNTFLFWGEDGIYNVAPNQFGDYIATNITIKTIQKFYNNIDSVAASRAKGIYDLYEKKVRWLYNNTLDTTEDVKELVLDSTLGAFYPNRIKAISSKLPLAAKAIITEPFRTASIDNYVYSANDLIIADSNDVIVPGTGLVSSVREVKYIVILSASPNIIFTFGSYKNEDHYDWKSVNGIGVDAASYLLTGALSGGDFQRKKNVPYLTVHLTKTETGFDEDYNPINASSCLIQAQWDWSNTINSNRWSKQFQAYRFRKHWIPQDNGETFDNGFYVVETKNKLRGNGKVVSFLFQSEPGKHMELLGWSLNMQANSNV